MDGVDVSDPEGHGIIYEGIKVNFILLRKKGFSKRYGSGDVEAPD